MRKTFYLLVALICVRQSLNASILLPDKKPVPNAKNIMIPLPGTNRCISLQDFLKLTPSRFKEMTGKKMSMDQKIDLAMSKRLAKRCAKGTGM